MTAGRAVADREPPALLAVLFESLRDLAVLAAATGVAWWCWEQYRVTPRQRDEAARESLTAERKAADLSRLLGQMDERLASIAASIEQLATPDRDQQERQHTKVRVHRLLHDSTDPFLTFAEIEQGLRRDRELGLALIGDAAEPEVASGAGSGHGGAAYGDGLREILIELVRDGVVAQLDRDRYFIASDYETEAGAEARED